MEITCGDLPHDKQEQFSRVGSRCVALRCVASRRVASRRVASRRVASRLNITFSSSMPCLLCELTAIAMLPPELDPPVSKDNDTCLEMFTFSLSTNQWLPQPQNACWRSGLVIKTRVPRSIDGPFNVTLTGHRVVCSKPHITLMTRNYHICRLSGVTAPEAGGGLTTCVAECQYTQNKTKYVITEIPNKNEDWKLHERTDIIMRNDVTS